MLSLEGIRNNAARLDLAAPGAWLVRIEVDVTFSLKTSQSDQVYLE